jgi:hypothetical protein
MKSARFPERAVSMMRRSWLGDENEPEVCSRYAKAPPAQMFPLRAGPIRVPNAGTAEARKKPPSEAHAGVPASQPLLDSEPLSVALPEPLPLLDPEGPEELPPSKVLPELLPLPLLDPELPPLSVPASTGPELSLLHAIQPRAPGPTTRSEIART